jgi:hypothetical protein
VIEIVPYWHFVTCVSFSYDNLDVCRTASTELLHWKAWVCNYSRTFRQWPYCNLESASVPYFSILEDCSYYIIWTDALFFGIPDRLSGVMDDRGKFICISTEEMKAVAEYIRKEGRVSISHLANNSNQFIDLEPKAQYNEEERLQAGGEEKISI